MFRFVLTVWICLLTTATAFADDNSDRELLLGKWIGSATYEKGKVLTAKFELMPDGLFSGTAEFNHKQFWSYSGQWSVKDHKLFQTYTKSSIPLTDTVIKEITQDTGSSFSVTENSLVMPSEKFGHDITYHHQDVNETFLLMLDILKLECALLLLVALSLSKVFKSHRQLKLRLLIVGVALLAGTLIITFYFAYSHEMVRF